MSDMPTRRHDPKTATAWPCGWEHVLSRATRAMIPLCPTRDLRVCAYVCIHGKDTRLAGPLCADDDVAAGKITRIDSAPASRLAGWRRDYLYEPSQDAADDPIRRAQRLRTSFG